MNLANPLDQLRGKITGSDYGTIFVPSDFSDLAGYGTVKMGLSRLEKAGLIRRVIRGVYEYPEFSNLLNEYVAPSPHQVALALARNFAWTIVPHGDTALNQLGLSTQVPAEWTYVSDGPYKEYSFGKTVIRLNHTANKDISNLSYKSALIVQAIKAIGQDRLDGAYIRKIAKIMTADERAAILAEGKYITSWVYEAIKKICNGGHVL